MRESEENSKKTSLEYGNAYDEPHVNAKTLTLPLIPIQNNDNSN